MMRNFVATIALTLASCAANVSAPPTATASAPAPRSSAASSHLDAKGTARVILVSFDGLSADEVETVPTPSFNSLPTRVARVVPINPTETSSTHAAILTGETPDRTGIVSNRFHVRGRPENESAVGLQTEIGVDTIVDKARRAGKRTGAILFPFMDGASLRRFADFGVAWSNMVTPPHIVHLHRTDFRSDWLPPSWGTPAQSHPSFSPEMRARIEWVIPDHLPRVDVDLIACDSTDDQKRNYDTFYVVTEAGEVRLDATRWFATTTRLDDGMYGSWSKLLRADDDLESVTLYIGATEKNRAYPAEFAALLDREIGTWPGEPDAFHARAALSGGDGIDPDTYSEQVTRLSQWITRATTLAMTRMKFDLLLSYDPILDETEHQWLLVSDRQLYGTPRNIAAAAEVMRRSYAAFDDSVAAMQRAMVPATDALVITGDHGLAPVDSEVRVNAALPSGWRAFTNGNVAEIYRFHGDDDPATIVRKLRELRSPDGDAVFESVRERTVSDHPNAGDITAVAYPRFSLSNGAGELFANSTSYGQHGGLDTHHEYETTLGASGAALGGQQLPRMSQTEIEPLVERLLGLR